MPRPKAKEHWKIDKKPDEWYKNRDPWGVEFDPDEKTKAERIFQMMRRCYGLGIDVGCGEGVFTDLYSKKITTMLGCDISHVAIDRAIRAHKNIVFFQWDIREPIPNLDGQADVIILSEVLYYIEPEDREKVVDNLYKMLMPGGDIIICVSRYFTMQEIRELFSKLEFWGVSRTNFKDDYALIMCGSYVPDR
jgi:SAM-dependent methyltransferase